MKSIGVLFALVLTLRISAALAVLPDEMLDDPALEARARAISKELRCVVCQNQTIDDSNAPLAHDMRIIVRERIVAGDSDDEIKNYLVARYGDFVLMRPPLKSVTLLLWAGPLTFLALGFLGFGAYLRNSGAGGLKDVAPLTDVEASALARANRDRR